MTDHTVVGGAEMEENPIVTRLLTPQEIDLVSGGHTTHAQGFASSYSQSPQTHYSQGAFSSYNQ